MKAPCVCPRAAWALVISSLYTIPTQGQSPWINELHYDNAGTDRGEFVEVVVPEGFAELSNLRLTLYNGGDGKAYGTSHLLDSFTLGETSAGFSLYSKAIGSMQNGAPDGMSLDLGGTVLQFISYEGAFEATSGPATGLTSIDIGVAESDAGTPESAALGLIGSGSDPSAFLWSVVDPATPGGWNTGQSMVPEPGPAALLGAGSIAILARRRPRKR